MTTPIEVEAVLRDDLLEPRTFLWNGRRHRVLDLGRHWKEPGQIHWLVRTHTQKVFELIYRQGEKRWIMGRTPNDFQPRGPVV